VGDGTIVELLIRLSRLSWGSLGCGVSHPRRPIAEERSHRGPRQYYEEASVQDHSHQIVEMKAVQRYGKR